MPEFRPPDFPPTARLTPRVRRVLGLNPGLMTGPGTNTYLVGERRPILLDTGAGVHEYLPLLHAFLASERLGEPIRVALTHRHRDHMGGVRQVRTLYPRLPVAKLVANDGAQSFSPNPATVAAGQTVVWHNVDRIPHHVVFDDGELDTGDLAAGAFISLRAARAQA